MYHTILQNEHLAYSIQQIVKRGHLIPGTKIHCLILVREPNPVKRKRKEQKLRNDLLLFQGQYTRQFGNYRHRGSLSRNIICTIVYNKGLEQLKNLNLTLSTLIPGTIFASVKQSTNFFPSVVDW